MESVLPRFRGIGTAVCRDLLAAHDIGRIAWHNDAGIQLLPVSYVWADGAIMIRASPTGALADLANPTDVVFEVDELDPKLRTGWSVIVRGKSRRVISPDPTSRLFGLDGPVPWASGVHDLVLQVTPGYITGRQLVRDLEDGGGR